MNYPADLRPSTTERLALPSGRIVSIPKATPVFTAWQGPAMPNTFGDKPALDCFGAAGFAELVILRTFLGAGWSGRWIETYAAPRIRPRLLLDWADGGITATVSCDIIEPDVVALLDAIAQANGQSYTGCPDVVAWRGDHVVFAEAKHRGNDRFQPTQRRWIEAALGQGLPEEALLLVEWRMR